jgi:hypothetical protein
VSKSKQHHAPAARQRKVTRRQADEARAELAAGGLSHQERRKLRAVTSARDAAARRRRGGLRHFSIVAGGVLAAIAVATAATGLISAIDASSGQGTAGTFIVGTQGCMAFRGGCAFSGTFQSGDGVTQNVDYDGTLPANASDGSSIPAIEPMGSSHVVYPPHGSRVWVDDLVLVLLAGGGMGLLLWLLPLGEKETGGAVV